MTRYFANWAVAFTGLCVFGASAFAAETVDFNRDIRSILSNTCYKCHGPDPKERKGGTDGLRLDTPQGALADLGGGHAAVVPGNAAKSELVRRITTSDPDERMPPPESGKRLTAREIELLTQWVEQGAKYAMHWSHVRPVRPAQPKVVNFAWPRNPVDFFILARLERERIHPAQEADRYALIRRLSLDLTGLPPTIAEADHFANDPHPDAYERLVDRLLEKDAFGEHWARMWLDLARYADSAGYADDPARTIWAFRDYVIRSLNANKSFDQFTIEQMAGDLLPDAGEEQLTATAFHRNTLTNSEGGTNDEEFRNVAVVDRVNTTWATWMGTSMACAQCHTHKYDPLSQQEFFRFMAILNNSEDADRRDEAPLLEFFTPEQKRQRGKLQDEIQQLDETLKTPTPELITSLERWEQVFPLSFAWQASRPTAASSQAGSEMLIQDDRSVVVAKGQKTDVYTLTLPLDHAKLTAIRLETLPHDSLPKQGPGHSESGNFVISRMLASITPPESSPLQGRFVRIEIPGRKKILSLAEVQVLSGADNVALNGSASQSSTDFDAPAQLAIDGNTNGKFDAKSVTHTAVSKDPWWEVDLKSTRPIDRIVLWNRTDPTTESRLADFQVSILDEQRHTVWEQTIKEHPAPNSELATNGVRPVNFSAAFAESTQAGFDPAAVINNTDVKTKGWAIGSATGQPNAITLVARSPVDIPTGSQLTVTIEQLSKNEFHTLGRLRLSVSDDARVAEYAQTPSQVLSILRTGAAERTPDQLKSLREYYFANKAPELQETRDRLASVRKRFDELKPNTVPIMRELLADKRRQTRIQFRGNFLDLGDEVSPGVPAAFHPLPEGLPNRLALAKWLVDDNNPLTSRVIANRFWEQIFGIGLVRTSEEFGSQGELPSHPELLDWLAVELVESKWDIKCFLKLLVTSAAYRQSSKVSSELIERDPENRLLSRGPRFRLSAEMVRDQALFVSGLLSGKMYGPSVKPPQPALGLNAAFGSAIDWKTSDGMDRYRRGLYTEWRRSNPYPSMITFDAPNREVCTIRRNLTNTPLQALVTLNDPVYVECAQSLARRITQSGTTTTEKAEQGFRMCLARPPYDHELTRLVRLYQEAQSEFATSPEQAKQFATSTPESAAEATDVAELASWTVVANVLLNLDEMLMKR